MWKRRQQIQKSAMNKIQLIEAIVNTTSSLATAKTMEKRYTWT